MPNYASVTDEELRKEAASATDSCDDCRLLAENDRGGIVTADRTRKRHRSPCLLHRGDPCIRCGATGKERIEAVALAYFAWTENQEGAR